MIKTAVYYAVRVLWTSSGLGTVILGATAGSEDWLVRAFVVMSGIVTLLLSILLGGFVKHLAGHQADRADVFQALENRTERMFGLLEKAQTKENCDNIHAGNMALMSAKLESLENMVKGNPQGGK